MLSLKKAAESRGPWSLVTMSGSGKGRSLGGGALHSQSWTLDGPSEPSGTLTLPNEVDIELESRYHLPGTAGRDNYTSSNDPSPSLPSPLCT